MLCEALAPGGDGVVVAAQFLGDLEVGGPVVVGGSQDDPGAASQRLGCGSGAGQAEQVLALLL